MKEREKKAYKSVYEKRFAERKVLGGEKEEK